MGIETRTCLDAALRHIAFAGAEGATIFSRYPSLLQFFITGVVDFKFELVKFG
eukprot:CAMPEP_0201256638 /NCGR_PEP_ID=MMETSP0853-20130426/846_1 /ASSEMBLY_ACC=CAM_ASM_000640 /TAXON_ID=183588 /ORGANISM="Pseudo-nitzschia fraudulenta, Strain WWA7" /LENGTH=52 /DNA_ID=CAMNT_0047556941 /DNA_START=1 /DNA_END=156 /DNA_ORIENTATION=-